MEAGRLVADLALGTWTLNGAAPTKIVGRDALVKDVLQDAEDSLAWVAEQSKARAASIKREG